MALSDKAVYQQLLKACRLSLQREGMVNLPGFLQPIALEKILQDLKPLMKSESFTHQRKHNIYFKDQIPGLAADHPALRQNETINHTLCADQLAQSLLIQVYEYPPLRRFLADVLQKDRLFLMEDPLARVNVMAYRAGEALNWHFDRSEFTITLLLQAPEKGGVFEYRMALRSDNDPNYSGVAELLENRDKVKKSLALRAGTLNVFCGKNTAHRVTPVEGTQERIVAVLSYYEQAGVYFSAEEQQGFYGRTAL